MPKNLKWLKNTPIAHRGLHDNACPENSLAAFKRAVEKKYAIETDIQILKDGTVVVFHDQNLLRLCGADKNLFELNYADLKDLKILNTEQTIPTLKQFLDTVGGAVPLLIEYKIYNGKAGICEAASLKELDGYKGQFAIQAFNPFVLLWFRRNRPDIIRGQLSCYFENEKLPYYKKYILKRMLFNGRTQPDFVSYDVAHIRSRYVRRARAGRIALAWPVQTAKQSEEIKPFCDNIIFENFLPTV
jgi:glycerophosphoryl diester phosphodiesterase